jgi:hypothetical protein
VLAASVFHDDEETVDGIKADLAIRRFGWLIVQHRHWAVRRCSCVGREFGWRDPVARLEEFRAAKWRSDLDAALRKART